MDDTQKPIPDPAILDGNLQALREVDAQLAETLTALAATGTPQAVPVTARDGRPTFRLRADDGTTTWFGRTSIPHVRAEALLEHFQSGQGNVLLPGLGAGSEAAILTRRMVRHRAAFVWEADNLNILLALRLHDVAQAIAEQRLVFIVCEADHLAETLASWLDRHPGHLCPDRILMWPGQTPASIAPCRSAVETAYQEAERARKALLAEAQQHLAELPVSEQPPSVAILSIHPLDETWAITDALAHAAANLGWRSPTAVIRTPADVHPLARAARLAASADTRPDLAVLVDVCRHEVRDVLPPAVPAVTWATPLMAIDNGLPSRLGEGDIVAAVDQRTAERLADAGVDRRRVCVQPLPCLLGTEQDGTWPARSMDVLIVGSLRPLNAASFGLELPTHMQVWEAAVEILRERVETFTDDQIEQILTRAETRTGSRIEDPETRGSMAEVLAGPAARVLILRNLAQTLVRQGFTIHTCGHGWSETPGIQTIGTTADMARRVEIYHQTRLVIQADPAGSVGVDVLLAAASGAVVVWRNHPRETAPGGIATLLNPGQEYAVFRENRQLSGLVRHLLGNESERRHMAEKAADRCRRDHSPTARLQSLQAAATSLFPKRAV